MMKALSFVAAIAMLSVAHLACNPDCQSIQGVGVNTKDIYNEYQFVITANPLSSLEGRKVFIGDVFAPSTFNAEMGLIVTVPEKAKLGTGNWELRIEDPDCLDVFILDNFQIREDGYFDNLGTFSPPIPPQIVIPNIPISYPSSIDNAWLSPDNVGYCLWFTMYKDTTFIGNDTILHNTNLIDPERSFEQATCACERDDPQLPYATNRMGGVIDTANMNIEIYIQRSPDNGGVEYFTGEFIDYKRTDYYNDLGYLNCPDPCAAVNKPPITSGHMLLLTSKKTGKQVVAFQLTGFQ